MLLIISTDLTGLTRPCLAWIWLFCSDVLFYRLTRNYAIVCFRMKKIKYMSAAAIICTISSLSKSCIENQEIRFEQIIASILLGAILGFILFKVKHR